MISRRGPGLALLTVIAACAPPPQPNAAIARVDGPQALDLFDSDRQRPVPVMVYGAGSGRARPLALLSPGYGMAAGDYGFIARHLAARGYLVAAVRHQLSTDPPLPTSGEPRVVRMPSWQQGADNLMFVCRELVRRGQAHKGRVLLVGHSHGGDTSMVFARQHPKIVSHVFSLDSRRQPFPWTQRPRICSIRSSDQAADAGVLPPAYRQRALGMSIVQATGLRHDEMWDGATPEQRGQMLAALERCLS